ncbi:MAG TPA: hypothetical protein VEB59_06775 [Gemmatimonadales bacterium]|nr:hypothetical protein [Gemmatimonadales bacterium]
MSQGESEHPAGVQVPSWSRTLFAVLGGALAWTLHFLGSYALVAIACVEGWTAVRAPIAAATVALLLVAVWSTAAAWRGWRRVSGDQTWDTALGEPKGWYAFLMLTGVLLGLISALTIALEGFGGVALPVCGWDVR